MKKGKENLNKSLDQKEKNHFGTRLQTARERVVFDGIDRQGRVE